MRLQVRIFWDLDNLPPDFAPPAHVVQALKSVVEQIGSVTGIEAWGNPNTFRSVIGQMQY